MVTFNEAFQQSLEYFDGDELAANVFLTKPYALTTPEGDILEPTPDFMHRRLASSLARIENKYENPLSEEEIYGYLKGFKYIVPQGSPMSGIGNPYQITSISNCFTPGTKVHTVNRGVVNIEDICIGDAVVTHTGRVQRVSQTHKNKLNGRGIYDIKCYRTPSVSATGNHEFMSISKEQIEWGNKPSFNPVEYLRSGDYIQIPNNRDEGEVVDFDLSALFGQVFTYKNKKYEVEVQDSRIRLVTLGKNGNKYPHDHWMPKVFTPDENFAYFLGLWFGDGCIFGTNKKSDQAYKNCEQIRGITFTFGSHERKITSFVLDYLTENSIPFDMNENGQVDGTTQIVIHSPVLGYAFENWFGRGFGKKKLHSSIHNWPKAMVESLAQGLVDNDGTITQQGDVRVVLANKSLISEFYCLLRSRGILVGYSETERTARLDFGRSDIFRSRSNKTYQDSRIIDSLSCNTLHTLEIDGNLFVRIINKTPSEQSPEYVYTFGVDDDHSYSVEGLISKNCFVIESPFDSYGGILKADQEEAQIMKRRGGVGFDISPIRPRGTMTTNAAKTSDGIGVFMERFSNTCREVGQGGRRGALMITLSVHHPDIRTFINIKRDLKKVTGANISIRLSDEFMIAVQKKEKFQVRWPVDSKTPTIVEELDAVSLWNEIIEAAYQSAEPGLLFWDTIIRNSPADSYASKGFRTTSTNPCSELTLSPYDSCRLLLTNALSFVSNPFTDKASFDWKKYQEVARVAQRLMDDIVDLELEHIDRILAKIESDPEPLEVKQTELNLWQKIRESCANGRRTGTGLTAIGDTVAYMNMTYGSPESIKFVGELYRQHAVESYRTTVQLAKERGTFPVYEHELEKDNLFINRIMNEDAALKADWEKYGRRNIALLTTAPAGSVSICTQTTSGIEPVFMLFYKRRKKINPNDKEARVDFIDELGDRWQEYVVYHHGFKKWMEVTGKTNVEESPYFKATSNDIDWVAKISLQAEAQKWIDHSISNTTNIPEKTDISVVRDIYMKGWELGCKGVTIYRENSRAGVLVADNGDNNKKKKDEKNTESSSSFVSSFEEHHAPKRPEELPCDIYHMQVNGEKWNMFVGLYEGKPYEIFAGRAEYVSIPKSRKKGTIKKNGHYNLVIDKGTDNELVISNLAHVFENATESAFTRTLSLSLRHGVPIQFVVEQLDKGADRENNMFSVSKALMRCLKNYIVDGTKSSVKGCPKCKSTEHMIFQEGCSTCLQCGNSRCS